MVFPVDLCVKGNGALPFHRAVAVEGGPIKVVAGQRLIRCDSRRCSQVASNAAVAAVPGKLKLPSHHLLHGVLRQAVIGVHCLKQFSLGQFKAPVNGPAFAAVFLINVADGKRIFLCLPGFHQRLGVVRGAVIHDQPLEVGTGLALQRAVEVFQNIRPVIGRRKNRNFIGKFHISPHVSR